MQQEQSVQVDTKSAADVPDANDGPLAVSESDSESESEDASDEDPAEVEGMCWCRLLPIKAILQTIAVSIERTGFQHCDDAPALLLRIPVG